MELNQLLSLVMPRLPNCPRPVAERALLDASRDFCRQTHAMWAELSLTPTDPAKSIYEVSPPADTELIALVKAEDEGGRPLAAFFTPRETVGFTQKLMVPATVTLAAMPSRDAQEIPDTFSTRWDQAFADGALFRLLSTPKTEWFEPRLAEMHMGLYQRAVNEAKVESARHHNHADLRVQPRPFV